jgi:hypothetical protein
VAEGPGEGKGGGLWIYFDAKEVLKILYFILIERELGGFYMLRS